MSNSCPCRGGFSLLADSILFVFVEQRFSFVALAGISLLSRSNPKGEEGKLQQVVGIEKTIAMLQNFESCSQGGGALLLQTEQTAETATTPSAIAAPPTLELVA